MSATPWWRLEMQRAGADHRAAVSDAGRRYEDSTRRLQTRHLQRSVEPTVDGTPEWESPPLLVPADLDFRARPVCPSEDEEPERTTWLV